MKDRVIVEMSRPVAWDASPDLTNRETIGIMIVLGLIGIMFHSLGVM